MWGALGLYPLTGTDLYFVGSPAVDKATITLDGSKGYNMIYLFYYKCHAVRTCIRIVYAVYYIWSSLTPLSPPCTTHALNERLIADC